jgi:peptidoglycan/LPS O-acetylase OafA/YrhL
VVSLRNRALNLKHFWLRRIYRIWPPFYLVLLATALTLRASGPPFYSQLLHVTNYWSIYHGVEGMPAGTGIYWSLAVEEHFYLLFPWIFLAMQRMSANNQATLLYAMCAVVLAWRCWLVFGWHVSADRTYMATDTRIDSIILDARSRCRIARCAIRCSWSSRDGSGSTCPLPRF